MKQIAAWIMGIIMALAIGGIIVIGTRDALGIASTIADTNNIEAQADLTREETNAEIVGLLGELIEQTKETNRSLLEVIENLSRPNSVLPLALIGVIVVGAVGIVASLVLVIVLILRHQRKPVALPAPIDVPQLERGQWRIPVGEYVEDGVVVPVVRRE